MPRFSPTTEQEIESAILADSLSQLSAALEHAEERIRDNEALREAFESALKLAVQQGKITLAQHILEEGAEITSLSVLDVGCYKPSIALWSFLKSYGYDFNQVGPKDSYFRGRSVIHTVTHDERLVRWLIEECGVCVDLGEEDYWFRPHPPLVLQTCASIGSVACFKLIKERGAKVGRRTLHEAVYSAAGAGYAPKDASPDQKKTSEEKTKEGKDERAECAAADLPKSERKKNREEMLTYLVDELHLDVNALDTEDLMSDGCRKPSSWGRPLDYALKVADEDPAGSAVVYWLLNKGADPNIIFRKTSSWLLKHSER
jgi:hypothetical protein